MCQQAGLVKLGHVAVDGSKVKANASKHKAMSYERMVKAEEELAKEVEELLREAERIDAEEDAHYGACRTNVRQTPVRSPESGVWSRWWGLRPRFNLKRESIRR